VKSSKGRLAPAGVPSDSGRAFWHMEPLEDYIIKDEQEQDSILDDPKQP
jgi:hypothetical protein